MPKRVVAALLVVALILCLVYIVREAGSPPAPEAPEPHTHPAPAGNPPALPNQPAGDSAGAGEATQFTQKPAKPESSAQSGTLGVPGRGGVRRIEISDKEQMPEEIEIDGKKFKLVGKHQINQRDIKLERDGKTVTAKFPIPEEAKKKNEEPEESERQKGEER